MSKPDTKSRQVSDESKPARHTEPPTLLEWSVRLVAVLLSVSFFGFLAYQAVTGSTPAEFDFKLLTAEVTEAGDSWRTPVAVTNTGDNGAAEVNIIGSLPNDGGEIGFVLAHIGPGETTAVTVYFDKDPRIVPPTFAVTSYQ